MTTKNILEQNLLEKANLLHVLLEEQEKYKDKDAPEQLEFVFNESPTTSNK